MEEEDWINLYNFMAQECDNLNEPDNEGLDSTLECGLKVKLGAYIIENNLVDKTLTKAKWGV